MISEILRGGLDRVTDWVLAALLRVFLWINRASGDGADWIGRARVARRKRIPARRR